MSLELDLEKLRSKYERFSKISENNGRMYHDKAEEAMRSGKCESANTYYNMSSTAYTQAILYANFVNDLIKVTK